MKRRKRPPWWPDGDPTCPAPDMEEFDALPWPEQAPFLTADDLAVEDSDDGVKRPARGGGRFTLGDWVSLSFPRATCSAVVIEAVLNCLGARLQVDLHYHHMSEMPRGGTLRTLAGVWNEVMRELGYEPPSAASGAQATAEQAAVEQTDGADVATTGVSAEDPLQAVLDIGKQLSAMADARQVKNRRPAR